MMYEENHFQQAYQKDKMYNIYNSNVEHVLGYMELVHHYCFENSMGKLMTHDAHNSCRRYGFIICKLTAEQLYAVSTCEL